MNIGIPNAPTSPWKALFADGTPSLEEVVERLVRNPDLSTTRKRDFVSSLTRIASALGRTPSEVPADPVWLQRQLRGVSPAGLGISKKTWINISSNALNALRQVGLARSCFAPKQLNGRWQELWDKLQPGPRRALGRFITFCSSLGIEPAQVTDDTVRRFIEATTGASLTKPDRTAYALTRNWNRTVSKSQGGRQDG